MRNWIIIGIIVAAGLGWYLFPSGNSGQQIRYQTQPVAPGDIESVVNTAGTTKAVVTVEVGTEVSGLITELYVDFNDDVTQGQAIAKLDDRTYVVQLRQAEADVTMSQANLAQQQSNLVKGKSELLKNERAYKRQQELMRQGLTNQTELDNALSNYEVSEAQIVQYEAQIKSAEAQLLQRKAQLEQAELNLSKTTIYSPVNGTVIDRQVDIGQTVAASLSAPTLFTIAQDLSEMQIEADVDEADIGKVQQGQQVRFQVDAHPDRQFRGTVSQVRKAATTVSNVVTYKVIIDAPNQQQLLLPGMTANLNIIRGLKTDVLRVPNAALRFRPAGTSTTTAPGGPQDRSAELIEQLQLDSTKAAQVRKVFADASKSFQEARAQSNTAGPGPAGPGANSPAQLVRQKLNNELQQILSAEQYAKYQETENTRRPRSRTDNADQGTPAQVWILDSNNQPKQVNIRTGLSNDDFTEVLTGDLKEGDAVIVRAARVE